MSSANKAIVQQAQTQLPDRVKGSVQLDNYVNSENFNLFGYELTSVLDDIILVKYVDCSEDGSEIIKNGVLVPVNTSTFTWRIGKVLLAGPNCKLIKVGDHVCFPNDKGIAVGNLEITDHGKIKNSCFLNEDRIFGVCQPKDEE
jgi:hypothetical protein